ncbi:hypothetical protein NEOKW01_0271 [Nematocida sp. AWRm80]|nr:hypothetical protein NEOKW01_0271 [Nematocida sp. AWRm80]
MDTNTTGNTDGLLFNNVEEVRKVLKETVLEGNTIKEKLLRVYILNLILYKQLDQSHPVYNTLIKLSVYIELLNKVIKPESSSRILQERPTDKNSDDESEDNLSDTDNSNYKNENSQEELPDLEDTKITRRPINYVIEKNKLHTEKRTKKREERNPRIKNKRRHQDAKDLAERVRAKQTKY